MHDLAILGFLVAFVGLGFARPFVFVLAYAYVDIVAPQRLTYFLLNTVPVSQIIVILAVVGWAFFDDKRGVTVSPRQALLFFLLVYCGVTTGTADFPVEALDKWNWVWKTLAFAIFLPLTLRTRLRVEALALFMVLSAASIIIVGGVKTLVTGGGYGSLNLMVSGNNGLYEGSTLAAVAVAIVPLILWLARYGTIFPSDWRVRTFAGALIFACLLIPVGTEARTGLICVGVLGVLMLRHTKRRIVYLAAVTLAALIVLPNLPKAYTQRMNTIQGYQADSSASTRIAVWTWTIAYARDHPLGGGFDAYRGNKLRIDKSTTEGTGANTDVVQTVEYDQARAYHSAYFEMLGEQGYPGLALWLAIQLGGLWSMERLRARFKHSTDQLWLSGLASALLQAHIIYLVGAAFVGIAFQPFMFMLIGMQIGLAGYARRQVPADDAVPGWAVA